MNTPEDIKRKMLENASSDGPRFLEHLKARGQVTNPEYERQLMEQDHGLETPMLAPDELLLGGLPSAIRAGGKMAAKAAANPFMQTALLNDAGSLGLRSVLPVTKELAENVASEGVKGAVNVAEKGAIVPKSFFTKAEPSAVTSSVKLIDNGKFAPTSEVIKNPDMLEAAKNVALKKLGSAEKTFVPKYTRSEYLDKITQAFYDDKISLEEADKLKKAIIKLGVK